MGNKWADKLRGRKKKETAKYKRSQKRSMKISQAKMAPMYKELLGFVEDYFVDLRPKNKNGQFEIRYESDVPDPEIEFVSHFRDDGVWFEYVIIRITYCLSCLSFIIYMNDGHIEEHALTVEDAMERIVKTDLHWI